MWSPTVHFEKFISSDRVCNPCAFNPRLFLVTTLRKFASWMEVDSELKYVKSNFQSLSIVYCVPINKIIMRVNFKSWRLAEFHIQEHSQDRAQPIVSCTLPKRLIYSNITVKYSTNAVKWPCCVQPIYNCTALCIQ